MIAREWSTGAKDLEATTKVLNYGLGLMPNNLSLHMNLGETYFKMKKYSDSKTSFEKVLKLDKENTNAKDFLKRINKIKKDG